MRKKLLIIHNRMAGRRKAPLLHRVLSELERRQIDVQLKAASSIAEDIELAGGAADAGAVDAVVAAGGDSTIRGVAMGIMGRKMPLGIIPAGTGNVLAQELGLGRDPARIADVLIGGEIKTMSPGLANGEPFLLMAGAGFDAEIVRNLDHDLKQRIRKAAYIGPTLRALAAKPPALSVSFPEDAENQRATGGPEAPMSWRSYNAAFVVVTKVRHYGGRFVIAPEADLTADDFQVVMFMDRSRPGMVRALAGMAMGKNTRLKKTATDEDGNFVGHIMKTRGVMIRSARHVRIEAGESVPTQIDGEWLGTVPLDISVSDQKVNLIAPGDR